MKQPVIWSQEALDNLKQQIVYIAGDNPQPPAGSRIAFRTLDKVLVTWRPADTAG